MNEVKRLKEEIENYFPRVVNEIVPLLGKGEQYSMKIDEIATELFLESFHNINKNITSVNMLAIEGIRDGVKIPKFEDKQAKYTLVVDPIEGTLTGARGGSRCLSVVGLYHNSENCKKIPDEIDIFSIGSKVTPEFGRDFFEKLIVNTQWLKQMEDDNDALIIFHRSETREMLREYFGIPYSCYDSTDNSEMYFSNKVLKNIILIGDTTTFCPFEADYYMGRSGSVESRIESSLWKYWNGMLVSSEKMKKYINGKSKYIQNRISWANGSNEFKSTDFFSLKELERLEQMGWNDSEIRGLLDKKNISPSLICLWMCSLTGTKENKLCIHSDFNLKPVNWNNGKVNFEVLKVEGDCENRIILRQERNF